MKSAMWDGGFWNQHSLKGLGPQRKLRDCNIEEVAAHFGDVEKTAGMGFVTKGAGDEKYAARDLVIDLFGPNRFPGPIRILSMPALKWKFEGALLKVREDNGLRRPWHGSSGPLRTEFYCVENDRAIYYAAMMRVPGMGSPSNVLTDHGKTTYAERVMGYLWIHRYIFTDIDTIIRDKIGTYDCVWLDYTGPITMGRLAEVKAFMADNVTSTLVLTSLKGRWNREVSRDLEYFDCYEDWICHQFEDYKVEHYVEYFDTSPMVQIAISKR